MCADVVGNSISRVRHNSSSAATATAIVQPPPLFPPLAAKPLPIFDEKSPESPPFKAQSDWKQKLLHEYKYSPYYLDVAVKRRDVQRYSDKYKPSRVLPKYLLGDIYGTQCSLEKYFPRELIFPELQGLRSCKTPTAKTNSLIPGNPISESIENIRKNLENLEQKEIKGTGNEKNDSSANVDNPDQEEDDANDDDYYDEEEIEEGTDYNLSYFDNGEDFGLDDDGGDDEGPIY